MTFDELLTAVARDGLDIHVEGDELVVRAPRGAIDAALRSALVAHKDALMRRLAGAPRPRADDGPPDLAGEAALDTDLESAPAPGAPRSPPRAVLVTGAAGFIATHLLGELLAGSEAGVHCLVRARDDAHARERVRDALAAHGLDDVSRDPRVEVLAGDVSRPFLGMTRARHDALAGTVDAVYHCAATLNYVLAYRHLKPVNVLGTLEALRFAVRRRPKAFHLLSSFAVFNSPAYAGRRIGESDRAEHHDGIGLGYSQTKWVAEALVHRAADRGLVTRVYRMPFIGPRRHSGLVPPDDIVWRLVRGGIRMRCLPDLALALPVVPVDHAARCLAWLSRHARGTACTFHIDNPRTVTLRGLAQWMQGFGYRIEIVAFDEWRERLREARLDRDSALRPLLPFFLKSSALPGKSLLEQLAATQPAVDSSETERLLEGGPGPCPPLDAAALQRIFETMIDAGAIDEP